MDIRTVSYLNNVQSADLMSDSLKTENKKERHSEKVRADSIVISDEAHKFSEQKLPETHVSEQGYDKIAEKQKLAEQLKSQLEESIMQSEQMTENAKKMIDSTKEHLKEMELAMKIYKRMSKGARVSQEDEKALMDYSFTLFMTAKMEQMMAEKHEDMTKDSLTKKYSENNASSQSQPDISQPQPDISQPQPDIETCDMQTMPENI